MSEFVNEFPGDSWDDRLLEQNLERLIQQSRDNLDSDQTSNDYIERQIAGFGNTTQLLITFSKGAVLTDQKLTDAALSLMVYKGRIHVQSAEAHLHPEQGTNLFFPPGDPYEIQAVDPAAVIATFMWAG
ncbi:MAG: hypothetical protein ABEJ65_12400 [bacterium]